MLMSLPVCRHRGQEQAGFYPCRSCKLIVPAQGVTAETCARCPYADVPCPEGPPRPPGPIRRAFNFVLAAGKHALDAGKKLSSQESEARLAICRACPSGMYQNGRCLDPRCGCVLAFKVSWRSETCPRGHW
jgi:hypothetical protein